MNAAFDIEPGRRRAAARTLLTVASVALHPTGGILAAGLKPEGSRMSAGRICTRVVATAAPGESARAAARRMADHDVGSLVVVTGPTEKPVGLLTDRDLALRCLAAGLDPDQTPVEQLMTAPAETVDEHAPIEQAVSRMASAGVRRLVVTGPGETLMGVLSLDDVLDLLVEEVATIGRLLEKQAPRIAG